MATLNVVYRIGANITDLKRGMDQAARETDRITRNMNQLSRTVTSVGQSLSLGITAPLAAVGGAAIKMGMDAIESENLFSVAFENMAASARAWSERVSDALGLNEFELRRNAATMFTMFEAMEIGRDAAFDMATGITELANDMASFFNLRPEEAFEKLRAGIVGESEPLKRLGILVDETTVKMAAMKNGLIDQGDEMSQQQKVLARYMAILEQTEKAQGDLARTMDSPTNQLRSMRAEISETATKLGMALMPAFEAVLDVLPQIVGWIQRSVQWFANLSPPMRDVIVVAGGLAAALGPVLIVTGSLISSIAQLIPVFALLKNAFIGIAATQFGTIIGPGILIVLTGLAAVSLGRVIGEMRLFSGQLQSLSEMFEFGGAKMLMWLGVIDDVDTETLKLAISSRRLLDEQQGQVQQTEEVTRVTDEMRDIFTALNQEFARTVTNTGEVTDEFQQLESAALDLADPIGLIAQKVNLTRDQLEAVGSEIVVVGGTIETLTHEWEANAEATRNVQAEFGSLGTMLPEVTTNIGNVHDVLAQQAPDTFFGSLGNQLQTFLRDDLGGLIIGAIQGGGDIARSIGAAIGEISFTNIADRIGTGLSNALGGTIGGAIGSIIPGVGTLLGSVFGDLIGGLFSFGGPSEQELRGRELANNFMSGFTEEISDAQLEEVFALVQQGWARDLAEFVVVLGDMYEQVGLTQDDANAAAQQLWDAIKEGPEAVQEAIDAIMAISDEAAQLEENARALEQAFVDLGDAQAERAALMEQALMDGVAAFQAFRDSGLAAGVDVPEAFRVMLEAAELLKNEVSGPLINGAIAAGNALKALDTIGEISGRNFRQFGSRIRQVFDNLVAGGANSEAALEALRQPLAQLILLQDEYGYSVDAGTQSLIDLAREHGITAAEGKSAADLQIEALDRVIETLELLIQTLGGELPTAAQDAAEQVKSGMESVGNSIRAGIPTDFQIDVGFRVDPFPNLSGAIPSKVIVPGFQAGTDGQFTDFGAGTLAMLHGREAIVPEGGGAALGREIAAELEPALAGAGVTVHITGPITVQGGDADAADRFLDQLTAAIQRGGRPVSRFQGALKQVQR